MSDVHFQRGRCLGAAGPATHGLLLSQQSHPLCASACTSVKWGRGPCLSPKTDEQRITRGDWGPAAAQCPAQRMFRKSGAGRAGGQGHDCCRFASRGPVLRQATVGEQHQAGGAPLLKAGGGMGRGGTDGSGGGTKTGRRWGQAAAQVRRPDRPGRPWDTDRVPQRQKKGAGCHSPWCCPPKRGSGWSFRSHHSETGTA